MYISASSLSVVERESCNYQAEVNVFRVHFLLGAFVTEQATAVFGLNMSKDQINWFLFVCFFVFK